MARYSRWNTGCCCEQKGCEDCVDRGNFICPPKDPAILHYGPYNADRFAEINDMLGRYWMPIRYDAARNRYYQEPRNTPGWFRYWRSAEILLHQESFQTYRDVSDCYFSWRQAILLKDGEPKAPDMQEYIDRVYNNILRRGPLNESWESVVFAFVIIGKNISDSGLFPQHGLGVRVYQIGGACVTDLTELSNTYGFIEHPDRYTFLVAMLVLCVDTDGNLIVKKPQFSSDSEEWTFPSVSQSVCIPSYVYRPGQRMEVGGHNELCSLYDPSVYQCNDAEPYECEFFSGSSPWRCLYHSIKTRRGGARISETGSRSYSLSQTISADQYEMIRYFNVNTEFTATHNETPDLLTFYNESILDEGCLPLFPDRYLVRGLCKDVYLEFQLPSEEEWPERPIIRPQSGYEPPSWLVFTGRIGLFAHFPNRSQRFLRAYEESCSLTSSLQLQASYRLVGRHDLYDCPSTDQMYDWLDSMLDRMVVLMEYKGVAGILGHNDTVVLPGPLFPGPAQITPLALQSNGISGQTFNLSVRTLSANRCSCHYAHNTGELWLPNVSCTAVECSHPDGPSLGIYSSSTRFPVDPDGNTITNSGIILVRSKYCNSQNCSNFQ